MGYSDSNTQLGQLLHKEYEATYSANSTNQTDLFPPVRFLGSIGAIVTMVVFVAQVFGA